MEEDLFQITEKEIEEKISETGVYTEFLEMCFPNNDCDQPVCQLIYRETHRLD